jgi:hypothetical protein
MDMKNVGYGICNPHSITCDIVMAFLGLAEFAPVILALIAIVLAVTFWMWLASKKEI